jgi:hypothetical protein
MPRMERLFVSALLPLLLLAHPARAEYFTILRATPPW